MSKKDIAYAFILLCMELIQSCLIVISPPQNAIELMYNITASLFLRLDKLISEFS